MLCLFKLSKPNVFCSQINLLHFYTLLYNLIFFTNFVINWFLWKRIINYDCSVTSVHIKSYLSNIVTRQSKDHKALRLLRKPPICIIILILFKYTFYQIRWYSWNSKILTIYMRHIFKYVYNTKHRCWTFEYIHTKSSIVDISNKMFSIFLFSIALSITAEPIPSTIHTECKSK